MTKKNNPTTDIINEGYIFNEKTIAVDIKKIKKSNVKKLLIFGLSGAGKTTLGKKLSDQLNLPLESTDDIPFDWKEFTTADNIKKDKILEEYIDECIKMILTPHKSILEGVGLLDSYYHRQHTRKKILQMPCIILGTSALKSGMRAAKRSNSSIFNLFFYMSNFTDLQKKMNLFRSDRIKVPGSQIIEFDGDVL